MINLAQIFELSFLKKMYCVCADCIGRGPIATAPKNTFIDEVLKQTTCACGECVFASINSKGSNIKDFLKDAAAASNIKRNHSMLHMNIDAASLGILNTPKMFKATDINTVDLECLCWDCMGTWYKDINEKYYYLYVIGEWHISLTYGSRTSFYLKTEDFVQMIDKKFRPTDNYYIDTGNSIYYCNMKNVHCCCNYLMYDYKGSTPFHYKMNLEKFKSSKRLYLSSLHREFNPRDEVLKNVAYYREYQGYRIGLDDRIIEPSMPHYEGDFKKYEDIQSTAVILIQNKNKTSEQIIRDHGANSKVIFRILDTWCNECGMYKKSCVPSRHESNELFDVVQELESIRLLLLRLSK